MKEFTPEQITKIINIIKATFDDRIHIVDHGEGYSHIVGKDSFCKQVAIKLKNVKAKKPKNNVIAQIYDQEVNETKALQVQIEKIKLENKCVPSCW